MQIAGNDREVETQSRRRWLGLSQEQYMDRPAKIASCVIAKAANRQFDQAIAVKIPQRSHRAAKVVAARKSGSTVCGAGQLQTALHRTVWVHHQYMHRSGKCACTASGTDG